jgi:hypothetical protein
MKTDDYYIVVTNGGGSAGWKWEIQRRSKPLGIRLYATGFVSQAGAKVAGQIALKALLVEMSREGEA